MATKPPKSGRRRKVISPRRRKLIQHLAKGKSITEAERLAGYSTKYPGQNGSQALREMRKSMPEVLDALGLTDHSLVENYLKPLLNAKETVFAKYKGKFGQKRDVVSWGPRQQGLDMAFRLKGSYAASTEEGRGPSVQVILVDVPRPDRSAITVKPADPS